MVSVACLLLEALPLSYQGDSMGAAVVSRSLRLSMVQALHCASRLDVCVVVWCLPAVLFMQALACC
jgi:hypothetical protein